MSDNYVGNASSSSGLAHLQEEVLEDIQASFNLSVTYGIPTEELSSVRDRIETQNSTVLFLRDVRTHGGRFLNAPQRVFVVPHLNWIVNVNQRLTGPPGLRGRYLYAPAAILLHENGDSSNSWCRKTLIHETLHSVSLYSRIWNRFPNIIRFHRSFREGITECLVGYILLKRHPECYQGWKTNQLDRCSISYQNSVKLWCSLCQCVGIKDLAEFYLSSQDNLANPWNRFIQSIQTKNFGGFQYQLDERRSFNEGKFREISVNSIPTFREIYESLTRCLDFSRIPDDSE